MSRAAHSAPKAGTKPQQEALSPANSLRTQQHRRTIALRTVSVSNAFEEISIKQLVHLRPHWTAEKHCSSCLKAGTGF